MESDERRGRLKDFVKEGLHEGYLAKKKMKGKNQKGNKFFSQFFKSPSFFDISKYGKSQKSSSLILLDQTFAVKALKRGINRKSTSFRPMIPNSPIISIIIPNHPHQFNSFSNPFLRIFQFSLQSPISDNSIFPYFFLH